jgi:hypothetical protein
LRRTEGEFPKEKRETLHGAKGSE